MNTPEMKAVNSSQLSEIGYDETQAQLFARFHPNKSQQSSGEAGSLYRYEAVPISVWTALNEEGVSVGSTFIRLVKNGGFQFSKLS